MSKVKPLRLLAEERRREIVEVLDQRGRITVDEVVNLFGISAVTARADLDLLSDSGVLVRSHGGGIRPLTANPEHPLRVRQSMHQDKKTRIAEAAAELVKPRQTIILCTGSTSIEVARAIRKRAIESLTVITYALSIASHLADVPGLNLVMIGGLLRQVSTALVGPQAEEMMRTLHADHCFLPAVGLDLNAGVTTLDIMEAQLNRSMIANSAETTVIADSSKFGFRSLSVITDLRSVRRLITDLDAPAKDVAKLREWGLDVVLT